MLAEGEKASSVSDVKFAIWHTLFRSNLVIRSPELKFRKNVGDLRLIQLEVIRELSVYEVNSPVACYHILVHVYTMCQSVDTLHILI